MWINILYSFSTLFKKKKVLAIRTPAAIHPLPNFDYCKHVTEKKTRAVSNSTNICYLISTLV